MAEVSFMTAAPMLLGTGLVGWFGQVVMQQLKGRSDKDGKRIDADVQLEKHRDGLTFQLLAAAKAEVEALRGEVSKLRPLEAHLYHLQQAFEHIEALLATTDGDREAAERRARAFLNRMRRMDEARGTLANETQRVASALSVAEKALSDDPDGDLLRKLDGK